MKRLENKIKIEKAIIMLSKALEENDIL